MILQFFIILTHHRKKVKPLTVAQNFLFLFPPKPSAYMHVICGEKNLLKIPNSDVNIVAVKVLDWMILRYYTTWHIP